MSSSAYRRRSRKRARRINKLLADCEAQVATLDRLSLRMEAIALMVEDIRDHLRDRRENEP